MKPSLFRTALAIVGSIWPVLAFAEPPPERLVVATWNVEWFFDDYPDDNFQELPKRQSAPTAADWEWKLACVAQVIATIRPTILALQEVENRRVLYYLTRKLKFDYGLDYSVAFIEGEDYFTEQDVAVLAQSGLVGFSYRRQTKEMFDSLRFYNLSKHIFCWFEWMKDDQKFELLLANGHFRAGSDAASLRMRQARLMRHWISDAIQAGRHAIVLGDFNTEETHPVIASEGELGVLRGHDTPSAADDLTDVFAYHQGPLNETHLLHKQFDHILATPRLIAGAERGYQLKEVSIRRDLVIRGKEQDRDHGDLFWKIPADERDISDHYPVVAEFLWQSPRP